MKQDEKFSEFLFKIWIHAGDHATSPSANQCNYLEYQWFPVNRVHTRNV